ncbi:protein POOR HOMOLOGOUS SYNAPSIS 1 [Lactuca sativa]|uniref:Poor homologous synapsis 1 PH domain-containing protein n=1 Tax=Lactuca sativa TaxID=4236 RepID=A0A9R1VX92_LACSA|nr:protein POOR HOMOLOGOUS SYNAPSIS 1 [Lactuca sativa]XP_052625181.1 protein POOR HOMOLOGOUS SYNAPSIS 1 [Lactuca sativa]KAJ0215617.1 hypothetical protein LSAT_V11C300112570 [Lactuca sativa]
MAGPHPSNGSENEHQGSMSVTTTTAPIGNHWEVQYARFFKRPSLSSAAGAGGYHPSLVPQVKRSKGSWISSFTSLANLKLLTSTNDNSDISRSIILTVTLVDNVIEEHYISKLHFTWPHVSCLPGYPPRGSKIVFMSYKDHAGDIQKFALRFLTSDETERFMNFIKDIFGHEKIDRSTPDIPESKTPSQSEIVPSLQPVDRDAKRKIVLGLCSPNSLSKKSTQEWSPISSSPAYRPTLDWSPIGSNAETIFSQSSNPIEATLSQDVQEKLSAFPPSFTSLLTMATTQEILSEDVVLKNEIMKYLEDSSFQVMLSKVQKVVTEFEDIFPM